MKLALCFVVLFSVYAAVASAVATGKTCWICDYPQVLECGDPFANNLNTSYQEKCSTGGCAKYLKSNGDIQRTCSGTTSYDRCTSDNGGTSCRCYKDLCNSSTLHMPLVLTVLFTAVIATTNYFLSFL